VIVTRRPDTPAWLAVFANDLYGGQCARCQVTRPLEVAHLSNWPEVKEYVASTPGADSPLVLQPEEAYWLFHQPVNVVLLCCNCHCLFDGVVYTDVALADIEPIFGLGVVQYESVVGCRRLRRRARAPTNDQGTTGASANLAKPMRRADSLSGRDGSSSVSNSGPRGCE
jgi:hypothetical protein